MVMMRTYSQLRTFGTYLDRFEYLKLSGAVADVTFGHNRWVNQRFYRSREWGDAKRAVAARDLGYDLGLEDYPIFGRVLIHHMNPLTLDDLTNGSPNALDPEYLITVSAETHNAIHYGAEPPKQPELIVRRSGDTTLW